MPLDHPASNRFLPIALAADIFDNLQVFDEETCRDFLYELGLTIPQTRVFEEGIQEVFQQVALRFGPVRVADCLSLFYDLLEDESFAEGRGDEGDIWRSWRHAWKYRNVSKLPPAPYSTHSQRSSYSTHV